VRYSKAGEHAKAISYFGATWYRAARPGPSFISNKIFGINSQPKYEEYFGLALR
jgi:hypothetical protein